MTKGQVKWFDPKKGYGFIIGPENQDVFVHYSHIQSDGFRSLKDGEWVEYELVEGDKGWQARDVKSTGETTEVPGGGGGGGSGGDRGDRGGGGGGGGGKREGGRSGGGKPRPQRDRERSSDILTDRPRSAPKTVDRPPVDRPAGGGYESGPAPTGYEGYQGNEDD